MYRARIEEPEDAMKGTVFYSKYTFIRGKLIEEGVCQRKIERAKKY